MVSDPRLSDEATGLPPLEQVEEDRAVFVLEWDTSEGIVASGFHEETKPVKFLHVRGLVRGEPGGPDVEWAQAYIAISTDIVMDLAADLVKGTTEQFGGV
jgi:hypothetical protein